MLTYIFLYLPIVVLIVFSFNKQTLNINWEGFTLDWYFAEPFSRPDKKVIGIFHDSQLISAFLTSLEIAVLSTLVSVAIGTLGSFALVRFEFRTKTLWDALNYTKIIIAEVVAGVSTLLFFVQLDNWLDTYVGFDFFNIFQPGFWTVLIAHIAWNIPFVVVIIRARLVGFDRSIEEAGADLGANPVTVFFRITLPVIFPGILAASLLSFTLSFDDFVTTFFVIGQNYNTLPVQIWSMVRMGITPEINAISTIMMAISMSIIVVLELKARISEVL
ncbi:MAG TPA: ABC transporter permease [Thermoleophilia bacterium]|nr:ABC transporter permease [Thermoleophilia bacterium]HQJ98853.1 ABC transporter permease [Thermoleophilia bacterium]